MTDLSSQGWYIVKQPSEHCKIIAADLVSRENNLTEKWGPFKTKNQAIAKRVGLIRAGKCKPIGH